MHMLVKYQWKCCRYLLQLRWEVIANRGGEVDTLKSEKAGEW